MTKKTIYDWITEHVAHEGDECLIWPFSRQPTGYGQVGIAGRKTGYAHRVMCELAHGASPTPNHEVAHSCGRGRHGCVNPKHLSWKTPSENQRDRRGHGTHNTVGFRYYPKLTDEQVRYIRALKGKKTQRELAAEFRVSFQTISSIHRGKHRLSAV